MSQTRKRRTCLPRRNKSDMPHDVVTGDSTADPEQDEVQLLQAWTPVKKHAVHFFVNVEKQGRHISI